MWVAEPNHCVIMPSTPIQYQPDSFGSVPRLGESNRSSSVKNGCGKHNISTADVEFAQCCDSTLFNTYTGVQSYPMLLQDSFRHPYLAMPADPTRQG